MIHLMKWKGSGTNCAHQDPRYPDVAEQYLQRLWKVKYSIYLCGGQAIFAHLIVSLLFLIIIIVLVDSSFIEVARGTAPRPQCQLLVGRQKVDILNLTRGGCILIGRSETLASCGKTSICFVHRHSYIPPLRM